MKNFNWRPIEATKVLGQISQKRSASYERAVHSGNGRTSRKTRILILEGADLSMPLLTHAPGVTVIEIIVKPSAKLSLFTLHNAPVHENSLTIIQTTLEKNAALNSFTCIAGAASAGLVLETNLIGEGSAVRERTLYFGNNEQELEMFSTTTISAPNCIAEIESKGILTGSAHGRFDGNITIQEAAKKSSARLIEHTLLLSSDARMNAIPGLKIETNDVFAAHSASMTRVSDEQLFYLGSRGVEEHDAVRLIAEGFLKTIYKDIPYEKEIAACLSKKLCIL